MFPVIMFDVKDLTDLSDTDGIGIFWNVKGL